MIINGMTGRKYGFLLSYGANVRVARADGLIQSLNRTFSNFDKPCGGMSKIVTQMDGNVMSKDEQLPVIVSEATWNAMWGIETRNVNQNNG